MNLMNLVNLSEKVRQTFEQTNKHTCYHSYDTSTGPKKDRISRSFNVLDVFNPIFHLTATFEEVTYFVSREIYEDKIKKQDTPIRISLTSLQDLLNHYFPILIRLLYTIRQTIKYLRDC